MIRSACLFLVLLASAQDAPPKFVLDLGGGVKMEFVRVKAGKFTMGADERGERPEHEVTLTKDYWMQTTEVTQAQWKAITGADPSEFKGADLPVENISWEDGAAFLKKLNETAKAQLKDQKADFPTEAEWEYACRAGGKGKYSFGDDVKEADAYVWHDGNSERKTHAVGTKKPNAWGLHDLHGNVWEWCADFYVEEYPAGPATDPKGPAQGDARIRRGGSWDRALGSHTSSGRDQNNPTYRCNYIGMRAVLR